MEDAVAFSIAHVRSGGLPFVGLVFTDDGYVSDYGVNQVQKTGDPSAHAEIVAMRAMLRQRGLADLNGMSLLATGEPCGLCYEFALEHRIRRIYVAVDSDTVARWGFDYRRSYSALGIDRTHVADIVTPLPVSTALEPFERYLDRHSLDRHSSG
ncbi:tRNA-specific adenosine deaminase [Mycolicibacterium doricum]|nr:nucleoside deaminase [Mycolicibacterium doricum]